MPLLTATSNPVRDASVTNGYAGSNAAGQAQDRHRTETKDNAMPRRLPPFTYLPLLAVGVLLTGCTTASNPPTSVAAAPSGVHGYWYHDANHPNDLSGQPSPQAIYNAAHGTWLWPPSAASDPPR